MRRLGVVAGTLAALAVAGAAPAVASPVVQVGGTGGCVRPSGAGGCTDSGVLLTPGGLLVTSNTVYVTAKSVGTGQGAGVAIFDRSATTGELTRRPGAAGCISETGDGTTCADGHGFALDSTYGPGGMAVSADGTRLFVASPGSDAVVLLGRNPSTGALGQDSGAAGCISQTGAGPCNDGRGLVDMSRIAMSPDGTSLYVSGNGVATSGAGGVAWIKVSGSGLTQEPSTAACFQQATDAECASFGGTRRFVAGTGIAVSPDGEHLYAGSFTSSSVIVFDRTPASGAITQTQCLIGTATAGCTTAPELLAEVSGLRFASPTELWVAVRNKDNGFASGRFQRFDRNSTTGELSVAAGCVSDTALSDGCAKSPYLFTANDIAFTKDGGTAVAAAHLRRTILAFDRTPDGRLANTASPTGGCITALAPTPSCAVLRGVDNAFAIELSPDDRFVYGAGQVGFEAQTDGLTVIRRDTGPPMCSDQSVSVPSGSSIRITLSCTEPDGEPLTRTLVEVPSSGVLGALDQGAGAIEYAPGGTVGTQTLRFKATANGVDSAVATVTIAVQSPPPASTTVVTTPSASATIVTTPPASTPPVSTPATPAPPAKPARVTSPVRSSFRLFRRSRYTTVIRLKVVSLPTGATVTIRCTGKGCPFTKRTFKPKGARVDALKSLQKAKLRNGAKLDVLITKPGAIGKGVSFAITGKSIPQGRGRCLAVGSTKTVKC